MVVYQPSQHCTAGSIRLVTVKATRGSTNNENYVTQAVLGYFIFKTSHISCIGSHFYSIQIALKIPHIWCYMHYPLERIA